MEKTSAVPDELKQRLTAEQLHSHFQQLPAVIIAPALGALFTAWVLWDAVNTNYLAIGLAGVLLISTLRIFLYQWYFSQDNQRTRQKLWRRIAIGTALVSGSLWGSAAIFLYPPLLPEYEVYMLVLLALVPVAPVAALAVYMPSFYAYYIPCLAPFIITLGLQDSRAERMTALLLLMMMGATLTFANKYADMLAEAIRLRLQLADKKEALEQAAVVKTRFLAAASHDLRQPVHAMGLFLESLRNLVSGIDAGKLLQRIDEVTLNLRRMLDAMLDISRLDAQVVEVKRTDFSLGEMFDRLRDEYAPLAEQKGLRFHCAGPRAVVNSDPALLERILRNLLSNAIKYTCKGGILLGCRRHHGLVRVQVYDTGPGIPAHQLDEIFLEFTQLQNAERNLKKGLGLGLSITKRLGHLLQHKITVRSCPGKGSTFSVELPLAKDTPSVFEQKNTEIQAGELHLDDSLVVVIDDDEAVRAAMLSLLQQWGANVVVDASAEDVLKHIRKSDQTPDLLIIDYRLSHGKTALDAIAVLEQEIEKDTPTIIVTGDTAPERIREAHNAGYLLLHKPVDPERLKVCINALLETPTSVDGIH